MLPFLKLIRSACDGGETIIVLKWLLLTLVCSTTSNLTPLVELCPISCTNTTSQQYNAVVVPISSRPHHSALQYLASKVPASSNSALQKLSHPYLIFVTIFFVHVKKTVLYNDRLIQKPTLQRRPSSGVGCVQNVPPSHLFDARRVAILHFTFVLHYIFRQVGGCICTIIQLFVFVF